MAGIVKNTANCDAVTSQRTLWEVFVNNSAKRENHNWRILDNNGLFELNIRYVKKQNALRNFMQRCKTGHPIKMNGVVLRRIMLHSNITPNEGKYKDQPYYPVSTALFLQVKYARSCYMDETASLKLMQIKRWIKLQQRKTFGRQRKEESHLDDTLINNSPNYIITMLNY